MNPLYVGIDVSSRSNVVYLMRPDGTKHSCFPVANSLDGAKQLSKRIVSAITSESLTDVIIGLEATSVYGDNLVCFLREDGNLTPFNKKIHVLNPKQVKKFKDAYPDLPKNDYVDAYIIADALRFGRINNEVYMDDYRYKALQNLTRARFFAVQNQTKEKQRFLNYLFMKYSSLAQEKVFSNTFSTTALAIYEEFDSADELAYMDINKLTDFIKEKGKNRFPNPDEVAKSIQAAARGSYRLPKTVNDSVNQVLSISISSIRALDAQIKAFDKAIADQIELIPNTLTSIKGIGPVYSAGIIAEIGDINRFSNQAALAKHAGLAWNQYQSGDFESQNTRLIKSGNRFLKYYLCEAALSLVRCDSEYKRFYNLKYKEVNKYQHKRALALTARKFVRLVFLLLKDNRLYIPPEAR
ncbi:MAG: IS110 family transposase [Bacillota bacterium]